LASVQIPFNNRKQTHTVAGLEHPLVGDKSVHLQALTAARITKVRPTGLLLVTDFDGTLAPIVADASTARPAQSAERSLAILANRLFEVVVLSARSNSELSSLIDIPGVVRMGDFGIWKLPPEEAAALASFNLEAGEALAGLAGVRLELKPASTAVHFREQPAGASHLADLIGPIAERHHLRATAGRMVFEIRSPLVNKAGAVGRLIGMMRPDAIVYAGDDEADRPVFELLGTLQLPHLSVGVVSDEAPPSVFRACDHLVHGPGEMNQFLMALADWASSPGS
jgi:trehalose 6-phosphate phosphatase